MTGLFCQDEPDFRQGVVMQGEPPVALGKKEAFPHAAFPILQSLAKLHGRRVKTAG